MDRFIESPQPLYGAADCIEGSEHDNFISVEFRALEFVALMLGNSH